ncbi:aminoacyl-tRNA hydrolase [Gleimia sp. 6138-11-ORH1]|uniref:aminoacyl-tRNA hydrolase n=1 Tax=Gleimia sp. 6138-11-ORH1 TaxID=2973937 RepID=UPI00216A1F28|nr:aminoacyl-tRNA hydrolase [Gleimia sp. 6138-11-ORH1]MCS4485208.1 aminoacyl-tRNA hydrolase [Gleimia sp. 6138-11-ORH1]
MDNATWLIVGLGNPGAKYARNRHNVGHMVVQAAASQEKASFSRHKAGAQVATVRLGMLPGGRPGPAVHLAYLDSYMNVSGKPVAALMNFYKIDPAHLLVIHDEMDIDEHLLRLKQGGGEGGHNGLKSISQALGTKDYCRLRFGVGRPPGRMDPADYVLSDFPAKSRVDLEITINEAVEVITQIVSNGFAQAQQDLHTR